ncbi:MAG TPA: DUF6458 family protein [Propionibacteriaceae bacterium]|nr:DUF6458 family protein [Propionibacteriaceae bacterium]HPZ50934.1 DUF6458 family protein [Propionibacteriaceae bacterium]HQE30585.1 DUF6458 family protein [Propionibacteriaceae bacterium]
MTARIGGPIALIAVGLILAFGVNIAIKGANLDTIGYILAGAGVAWLIFELIANGRRTARTVESTTVQNPGVPGGTQHVEREVRSDG